VEVVLSQNDADTNIVQAAIQKRVSQQLEKEVIIVGEDVDLMVLMVALTPPQQNIYLFKPSTTTRNGIVPSRLHCSSDQQQWRDTILFVHAFCGCDTTSAFYRKGKHLNIDDEGINCLDTA